MASDADDTAAGEPSADSMKDKALRFAGSGYEFRSFTPAALAAFLCDFAEPIHERLRGAEKVIEAVNAIPDWDRSSAIEFRLAVSTARGEALAYRVETSLAATGTEEKPDD